METLKILEGKAALNWEYDRGAGCAVPIDRRTSPRRGDRHR